MKIHTLIMYTLTGALLVVGASLKAPSVCISAAVLFCTLSGIQVAENILSKSAKDAEIVELRKEMAALQKEHKTLAGDITNVAERAKNILGEVY